MAQFSYQCEDHGSFKISLEKRTKTRPCPICKKESKTILKTGSISVVERLDNGAMARAVERIHNIEDIINDRADKHTEDREKAGDS